MVTLASAHPDHRTVSVGDRLRFSKMTYRALQVYVRTSGSEADHRAGKHTKHSRTPNEGDVVPIESNDRHAWASSKNNSGTETFYTRDFVTYQAQSYIRRVD
jgi:hypothetical protein